MSETEESATQNTEKKNYDIDIDFENYSVPEDRMATIRAEMESIRGKTWLSHLCDWVLAEGQIYLPFGEQVELNTNENPLKRIAWDEGHVLKSVEIIFDGLETEIRLEGKRYLALQKLPKGEEILISQFNPEFTSNFGLLENEIHEQLKIFLKTKSDKTKAFQERFKK